MDENYKIYQVGAGEGGEAFLVRTRAGLTALIDAGYAYCAPQTYEHIRAIMGGAPIDWLLLTHSHYDHASAGGYLKQRMPSMKVAASSHAASVFGRPGAVATMRKLNDNQAHLCGLDVYEDVADSLPVDRILHEGDLIDLGDLRLHVLEAPGHTKCSLAFWDPQAGLLVSCETMGVYGGEVPDDVEVPDGVDMLVEPAYLTGYAQSMDFIRRVRALQPRRVVVPHSEAPFDGDRADAFVRSAAFWNEYAARRIMELHDQGASDDEVVADYKARFYVGEVCRIQPEMAFDLNASYTIPLILRESPTF